MQPKQNRWSHPLTIARSFCSTSHIQIQQSTAGGFLSSPLPLHFSSPVAAGSSFNAAPGGGFFRLLLLFTALLRLPLAGDDEVFRFLEGAEAAEGTAAVSVDLSRVLLCERFRILVAGRVAGLSVGTPKENELFVLTSDAAPVTAAKLRVRA